MAIETTSTLTNAIRTQYDATYIEAAMFNRLYDQFAVPYPGGDMAELMRGSSVTYNFLSDMTPGTTAISQTADVTPQILRDATGSITPTSRGEALEWAEGLDIQAYTNYGAERFKALGKNQAESIDLLAQAAALQGTFSYSAAARSSLDAGTAGNRATDSLFAIMDGYLRNLRVPGFITPDGKSSVWMALMHPYPFHDIRENGNVDSIGLYQDEGIHLNWELGKLGSFRIIVSAWAKTFLGAGAANGTDVDTTLSTAANALATSIVVAANTNIAAGQWLNIGTEETANTHYATNERVFVTATPSGTTVAILGEGANGGLRFDHASGATVNHNDSVYPIVFGGPSSLVKLYATDIGEFGKTTGPHVTGRLEQFTNVGWKWYGGYNRLVDNRILRAEVSTSFEA